MIGKCTCNKTLEPIVEPMLKRNKKSESFEVKVLLLKCVVAPLSLTDSDARRGPLLDPGDPLNLLK